MNEDLSCSRREALASVATVPTVMFPTISPREATPPLQSRAIDVAQALAGRIEREHILDAMQMGRALASSFMASLRNRSNVELLAMYRKAMENPHGITTVGWAMHSATREVLFERDVIDKDWAGTDEGLKTALVRARAADQESQAIPLDEIRKILAGILEGQQQIFARIESRGRSAATRLRLRTTVGQAGGEGEVLSGP